MNIDELHKDIEYILRKSGELIISQRMDYGKVNDKVNNEIVTLADTASQDYIVKKLEEIYPDISIYSEEGDDHKSMSERRWILDPLDGTTPWVWGNSGFSISLALEDQGNIVMGAVYDPVMQELFYAEKGKGAFRNETKIHVAVGIPLHSLFMVVDWGNNDDKRKEGISYYSQFLIPNMFARRIVPQFAPALGLCHIAEGRIHALVCNDTWQEDHAAASLILREAGGVVSNFYNTNSFNHREFGILASNEDSTHKSLVDFLKRSGIKIN